MEKFTILFKNDSFKIVQVKRRCRNGKIQTYYYVDFGYHDCGAGYQSCTVDFETKAELKDFIKEKNIQNHFSKNFLRG